MRCCCRNRSGVEIAAPVPSQLPQSGGLPVPRLSFRGAGDLPRPPTQLPRSGGLPRPPTELGGRGPLWARNFLIAGTRYLHPSGVQAVMLLLIDVAGAFRPFIRIQATKMTPTTTAPVRATHCTVASPSCARQKSISLFQNFTCVPSIVHWRL